MRKLDEWSNMGTTYKFFCAKCQNNFESVDGTDRGRYIQLKSLLCTNKNTVVNCVSGTYSQSTGILTRKELVCPECNLSSCLTEWNGNCPKCSEKLQMLEDKKWD